jgi:hypothetical protein
LAALGAAAALVGGGACGDDDGGGGSGASSGGGCVDYSSVDTNACNGGACTLEPIVTDVFQGGCNFVSCHSSMSPSPQEGLALGPQTGAPSSGDLDAIHAAIVNGQSKRSSLSLVVPGDPAKSWLLAKVEYKFSPTSGCAEVDGTCSSGKGCGTQMPQGQAWPADDPRIAMLRAWIAGGAAR